MRFESKRPTVVHLESLERSASPQQRFVVGSDDRLTRVDEPATCDGERDEGQIATASGTREPIASSRGRAFVQDSSTSLAGSESQTTPPPT